MESHGAGPAASHPRDGRDSREYAAPEVSACGEPSGTCCVAARCMRGIHVQTSSGWLKIRTNNTRRTKQRNCVRVWRTMCGSVASGNGDTPTMMLYDDLTWVLWALFGSGIVWRVVHESLKDLHWLQARGVNGQNLREALEALW